MRCISLIRYAGGCRRGRLCVRVRGRAVGAVGADAAGAAGAGHDARVRVVLRTRVRRGALAQRARRHLVATLRPFARREQSARLLARAPQPLKHHTTTFSSYKRRNIELTCFLRGFAIHLSLNSNETSDYFKKIQPNHLFISGEEIAKLK